MEIKTKYNIGEELFYANEYGKLVKAVVEYIVVTAKEGEDTTIRYTFKREGSYCEYSEVEDCEDTRIFKTKEDFYKHIVNKNEDITDKTMDYEKACELSGPFYLVGGYADLWEGTAPYSFQKVGGNFEEFLNRAADGDIHITQYDNNQLEVKISHYDGTNVYVLVYDIEHMPKWKLKEILEGFKDEIDLDRESEYHFYKPFNELTKEELIDLYNLI